MGIAPILASPRKIDIKQYANAGCRNGYGMCSDISVANCCKDQSSTWGFASVSISPLQDGDIGVMYEMEGNKKCGRIRDSQTGPVTCSSPLNTAGLDGAAWFDCNILVQREMRIRGSSNHRLSKTYAVGQPTDCKRAVSHDKLVLRDGHMFHISEDMPAHDRRDLYHHTFNGSTIDMLHQDLLAHEVDHDGVHNRAEENDAMSR